MRWRSLIPSFASDKRGVAAVEFALILPFMAVLYFGSIEVSLMISADRKVTQTASALADLVARTDEMDTAQMNDVFNAATALFTPYSASTAQMRVTSFVDSGGGVAKVAWSKGRNAGVRNTGDTVTLEPGVLPAGGSVIMAEVVYPYQSALGVFMPEGVTLHETFYLRPRNSERTRSKKAS